MKLMAQCSTFSALPSLGSVPSSPRTFFNARLLDMEKYTLRNTDVVARGFAKRAIQDGRAIEGRLGNPTIFGFLPYPGLDYYLKQAVREGFAGYTESTGYTPLREELSHINGGAESRFSVSVDNVFIGCGSSDLIGTILEVLSPEIPNMLDRLIEVKTGQGSIDPLIDILSKNEVITPEWSYVVYHANMARLGMRNISLPLNGTGVPDVGKLEELLTPNTKAVILATVGNPIVAGMTPEEYMQALNIMEQKAKEYGHPIFLIADIIYESVRRDRNNRVGPITLAMKNGIRNVIVLTVNSASKMMGWPGNRIGWGKASAGDAYEDYFRTFLDYLGNLILPSLGRAALPQQVALYRFFNSINRKKHAEWIDIDRFAERATDWAGDATSEHELYERFKEYRRAEIGRRVYEFANLANRIPGVSLMPFLLKSDGAVDPGRLNAFYVMCRFEALPRGEFSQAARLAEFALELGFKVPLTTPGDEFLTPEARGKGEEWFRVVALMGDTDREEMVDVMGKFANQCRRTYPNPVQVSVPDLSSQRPASEGPMQ